VDDPDMTCADPTLLRSALELTVRGWHVFPCTPGDKRPALRGNWQDLATVAPDRIRVWWTRRPYNIGIACGTSGLAVIDLDVSRDGYPSTALEADLLTSGADAFAALCREHGEPFPPDTFSVDTPSGGRHFYFAVSDRTVRNSAGHLGPHIDVRADGGYVIAPGSRIGRRAYRVRDSASLAPLPSWVRELLRNNPSPTTAARRRAIPSGAGRTAYAMAALRDETRLVATARPGTRNATLNRAAFSLGQLVAAGLIPPVAVARALAGAAERAGLPKHEARRTIRSGLTAGSGRPRDDRVLFGKFDTTADCLTSHSRSRTAKRTQR
jgi:hypothetical protein